MAASASSLQPFGLLTYLQAIFFSQEQGRVLQSEVLVSTRGDSVIGGKVLDLAEVSTVQFHSSCS